MGEEGRKKKSGEYKRNKGWPGTERSGNGNGVRNL